MAHYLIFIPGVSHCDPNCLRDVGLGGLLRDDENAPEMVQCDRGPSGEKGSLLTWRSGDPNHDPKMLIHDRQSWIAAPAIDDLPAERFWIGTDLDNPVQPRDLLRSHAFTGATVTMADGNSWMMPTMSRLPNRYKLQDGGEITKAIKEEYQHFYEMGMRVVSELMQQFSEIEMVRDRIEGIEEHSIPVEAKDGMKLVASALALNYRVTWELAFMLELLDESSGAMALMAFCELPEIRQSIVQKKTLDPILINVGWYSSNGKTD